MRVCQRVASLFVSIIAILVLILVAFSLRAVTDCPDVPRRTTTAFPRPVLLEVVLARLKAPPRDEDEESNETIQDGIHEHAPAFMVRFRATAG
jgi:hypothetical protein